jgi:hypothetical protein
LTFQWSNVTDLGYPIYPADRFGIIVDLMNMNMQAKEAYLTIYYDYIDGHPANMGEVKPVWLDAFQCMTSEIGGRSANAKFDFASTPWIANFEGEVLGTGGHLHDGGTHLDVLVNNKVICESVPTYGTDEEALARANIAKEGGIATAKPGGGMSKQVRRDMEYNTLDDPKRGGAKNQARPADPPKQAGSAPKTGGEAKAGHGGHAMGKHIIAMSICADNKSGIKNIPISPLGIKDLKKGQSWTLKAYYDYTKFGPMANGRGTPSTVMGISIMYAKTATKRQA